MGAVTTVHRSCSRSQKRTCVALPPAAALSQSVSPLQPALGKPVPCSSCDALSLALHVFWPALGKPVPCSSCGTASLAL